MRYKTFTYILGAMDLEMATIKHLLQTEGCIVVNATVDGFQKVRASAAYSSVETPSQSTVWIECCSAKGKAALRNSGAVLLDHHHKGDSGYDVGPEDYLRGSSIGQLLYFMVQNGYLPRWEKVHTYEKDGYSYEGGRAYLSYHGAKYAVPYEYKYAAAADHCLANAYKGACPAIDVEALKMWRLTKLATFKKMTTTKLMELITKEEEILKKCPIIMMGEYKVIDARQEDLYHSKEAGANIGMPLLTSKELSTATGAKVMLQATNQEVISYFMEEWAIEMDMTSVYGNRNRGIAGGFIRYKRSY